MRSWGPGLGVEASAEPGAPSAPPLAFSRAAGALRGMPPLYKLGGALQAAHSASTPVLVCSLTHLADSLPAHWVPTPGGHLPGVSGMWVGGEAGVTEAQRDAELGPESIPPPPRSTPFPPASASKGARGRGRGWRGHSLGWRGPHWGLPSQLSCPCPGAAVTAECPLAALEAGSPLCRCCGPCSLRRLRGEASCLCSGSRQAPHAPRLRSPAMVTRSLSLCPPPPSFFPFYSCMCSIGRVPG